MAKKTEMIEHRTCDLCGQEIYSEEVVTLHRSDNKFSGAKMAVIGALKNEPGQADVDICPACRKRRVSDVIDLMYPSQN